MGSSQVPGLWNKSIKYHWIKTVIKSYVQSIMAETLCIVFDNKLKSLCQENGGQHFQYLLLNMVYVVF
jgi:dsRNA-specific ribonuclease